MGTMTFGREADMNTSAAMFNRCRDAGINFIDCADIYTVGAAETILGELLSDCRDEMVITTKVFAPMSEDRNDRGCSRRHIRMAIDASLKRLKTDRVDVYFLHVFDETTPLEETLGALDDLVREGKVLYLGASNYAAWQIAKALGISARHGLHGFKCLQPMYSLIKRQAEVEILPMAQSENLGVISFSPLAGGLLTGKYNGKAEPEGARLLSSDVEIRRYLSDPNYETAERFTNFAKEQGLHPVSLALAWVGHHAGITSPIIGARNVEQLETALNSLKIDMTPELYAAVSGLSPTPPPATDRSETV
jgi:aryl-alcohol dehydrogenase-like predicted oxidoreductase